MATARILVVEDEQDILDLIAYNLKKEGYDVSEALSGEDGLASLARHKPSLVLLDLMLPEMDGLAVLRHIKSDAETRDIPVIIVSAKGEEIDVVTGLEMGADDYVPKPFRPRELIARIRTALRGKGRAEESDLICIANLNIDNSRREVLLGGNKIDLTYTEFEMLRLLAKRPGQVYTRYQIVDAVRGEDYAVTDRAVDVHVAGLRKKLGASGSLIQTVRNVGYRFEEPAS